MSKSPADIVDELLREYAPAVRNVVSENEELAEAIAHFMELKAANEGRVRGITLRWFYENKLRDRFGGPRTMDTVRKYVREVLRVDPSTGKAL